MSFSKEDRKEVFDFFENLLLYLGEPTFYDSLRGHVSKASAVVQKFVRRECKGEKLLDYFQKRKNYFVVDRFHVSLKKKKLLPKKSEQLTEYCKENEVFSDNEYSESNSYTRSDSCVSSCKSTFSSNEENQVASSDFKQEMVDCEKLTLRSNTEISCDVEVEHFVSESNLEDQNVKNFVHCMEYFVNILKKKTCPIHPDKLSGHLSQAPEHISTYLECNYKSFKLFFQDVPELFIPNEQNEISLCPNYIKLLKLARKISCSIPPPSVQKIKSLFELPVYSKSNASETCETDSNLPEVEKSEISCNSFLSLQNYRKDVSGENGDSPSFEIKCTEKEILSSEVMSNTQLHDTQAIPVSPLQSEISTHRKMQDNLSCSFSEGNGRISEKTTSVIDIDQNLNKSVLNAVNSDCNNSCSNQFNPAQEDMFKTYEFYLEFIYTVYFLHFEMVEREQNLKMNGECEAVKFFVEILKNRPKNFCELSTLQGNLNRAPKQVLSFIKQFYKGEKFKYFFQEQDEFVINELVELSPDCENILKTKLESHKIFVKTEEYFRNLCNRTDIDIVNVFRYFVYIISYLKNKEKGKISRLCGFISKSDSSFPDFINRFCGKEQTEKLKKFLAYFRFFIFLEGSVSINPEINIPLLVSIFETSFDESFIMLRDANLDYEMYLTTNYLFDKSLKDYVDVESKIIQRLYNVLSESSSISYSDLPKVLGPVIIYAYFDSKVIPADLLWILLSSNLFQVDNGQICLKKSEENKAVDEINSVNVDFSEALHIKPVEDINGNNKIKKDNLEKLILEKDFFTEKEKIHQNTELIFENFNGVKSTSFDNSTCINEFENFQTNNSKSIYKSENSINFGGIIDQISVPPNECKNIVQRKENNRKVELTVSCDDGINNIESINSPYKVLNIDEAHTNDFNNDTKKILEKEIQSAEMHFEDSAPTLSHVNALPQNSALTETSDKCETSSLENNSLSSVSPTSTSPVIIKDCDKFVCEELDSNEKIYYTKSFNYPEGDNTKILHHNINDKFELNSISDVSFIQSKDKSCDESSNVTPKSFEGVPDTELTKANYTSSVNHLSVSVKSVESFDVFKFATDLENESFCYDNEVKNYNEKPFLPKSTTNFVDSNSIVKTELCREHKSSAKDANESIKNFVSNEKLLLNDNEIENSEKVIHASESSEMHFVNPKDVVCKDVPTKHNNSGQHENIFMKNETNHDKNLNSKLQPDSNQFLHNDHIIQEASKHELFNPGNDFETKDSRFVGNNSENDVSNLILLNRLETSQAISQKPEVSKSGELAKPVNNQPNTKQSDTACRSVPFVSDSVLVSKGVEKCHLVNSEIDEPGISLSANSVESSDVKYMNPLTKKAGDLTACSEHIKQQQSNDSTNVANQNLTSSFLQPLTANIVLLAMDSCIAETIFKGENKLVFCLKSSFHCDSHNDCSECFDSLKIGDTVSCFLHPSFDDECKLGTMCISLMFCKEEASTETCKESHILKSKILKNRCESKSPDQEKQDYSNTCDSHMVQKNACFGVDHNCPQCKTHQESENRKIKLRPLLVDQDCQTKVLTTSQNSQTAFKCAEKDCQTELSGQVKLHHPVVEKECQVKCSTISQATQAVPKSYVRDCQTEVTGSIKTCYPVVEVGCQATHPRLSQDTQTVCKSIEKTSQTESVLVATNYSTADKETQITCLTASQDTQTAFYSCENECQTNVSGSIKSCVDSTSLGCQTVLNGPVQKCVHRSNKSCQSNSVSSLDQASQTTSEVVFMSESENKYRALNVSSPLVLSSSLNRTCRPSSSSPASESDEMCLASGSSMLRTRTLDTSSVDSVTSAKYLEDSKILCEVSSQTIATGSVWIQKYYLD